ncbi:N-acetylmuramoyl-L-alanine amidase [Aureimonas endophytica]|uniref:N-acetylmuramoyl-L-alanine amidase n=2 Tax=Aureimonas endophytica TaxID=2027858 RepID=A0A916ZCJ7_9HYPH|nr:N-acetylmuramoyl-L-alanine amidase [Aureimonas endophytica]
MAMLLAGSPTVAREPYESVLTGFSQQASGDGYVAEMRFAGTPRSKLILLARPNRVVIDLYDAVTAMKDLRLEKNEFVAGLRQGLISKDRFRLVFELKRPALPDLAMATDDGKTTLTLRLNTADAKAFADAAARPQGLEEGATAAAKEAEPERIYTVVIDPGHGGVDTGAIGKHGTLEKDVNLRFGLALRDALAGDPRVHVLMTREDDTFISLTERSEIARRAKANLFVSMHSDSIRYADLRGATVYTLSEKASDSLSREVADSENSADRFVDPRWREDKPEVFDILVELMRRETENLSEHFAAGLVQELGRHDIRLIRNPKRSAGFKVLTAPDVPSVLLEVGYLSNVDDEQLLLDESWRNDSAKAIAAAIERFLGTQAPRDKKEIAGGG